MAVYVTVSSKTSFSLPFSYSGSVPRSPQLIVKSGHFCLSAKILLWISSGRKGRTVIGLTSGKRLARSGHHRNEATLLATASKKTSRLTGADRIMETPTSLVAVKSFFSGTDSDRDYLEETRAEAKRIAKKK